MYRDPHWNTSFLERVKVAQQQQKYIYLNISTIHISPADVGGSVPLAEEHVAPVGVNHNGAGPLQVAQQSASVVLVLGAQHVQRSLPKI